MLESRTNWKRPNICSASYDLFVVFRWQLCLKADSCHEIKFHISHIFFYGGVITWAGLMISCSLHTFYLLSPTHGLFIISGSRYFMTLSLFASPVSDVAASVLGKAPGHSSAHRRSLHIHLRSTLSGDTSSPHRRLEPADQVSAAPRLWHIRVSDLDYATHEPFRASERNR